LQDRLASGAAADSWKDEEDEVEGEEEEETGARGVREAGVDDDTTVAVSKADSKKKKQMGAVAGAAIDRTNNKDFRLVSQQDVADGSVDLVVALAFPDEDSGGRGVKDP
jgi:hypothetical protein